MLNGGTDFSWSVPFFVVVARGEAGARHKWVVLSQAHMGCFEPGTNGLF